MAPQEVYPKFADLSVLDNGFKKGIQAMGLVTMTEVQAKTFEPASQGNDVLARARTGTGKTISFLLPAVHQLKSAQSSRPDKNYVQMLILSPTRELASQIEDQAKQLTQFQNDLSTQVVFGGTSKGKDENAFKRRVPSILVATPGRLRDHLQGTRVHGKPFSELVSQVKILVLDETDRLLDMGFRREVEDIISYLPSKQNRQTLLFSATVPPEVKAVMRATMKDPHITVDCIHDKEPGSHTNQQVEQTHVIVQHDKRLVTGTIDILMDLIEADPTLKMVVFFPTTNIVAFYAAIFNDRLKIPVLEIHSRKSQSYRTKASDKFREAESGILFTSDVSARGVDYPGVTNVVQFGIPDSRETYIHRLGRTGRAGKVGEGLLVLSDYEQRFLQTLKGLDVPLHQDMQALIDSDTAKYANRIDPILNKIKDGKDKQMLNTIAHAYRSMLGFYNGKLGKLGVKGNDKLIGFCNEFAYQTGVEELPEIELKMLKKMGLAQASGLNVVKVSQSRLAKMNGGGGRGGGRGGVGNNNSNNSGRNTPKRSNSMNDKEPDQKKSRPDGRRNGNNNRGGRGTNNGGGRGGGRTQDNDQQPANGSPKRPNSNVDREPDHKKSRNNTGGGGSRNRNNSRGGRGGGGRGGNNRGRGGGAGRSSSNN